MSDHETIIPLDTIGTVERPEPSAQGKVNRKIAPDLEDFQNPMKVFHHLDRLYELQTTGDTRPIHMTIGFTNYCNHQCPWCYINWNQAGGLNKRSGAEVQNKKIEADMRLIEAVAEAKELGLKAVTIVGDGESTMHPRFLELFLELAKLKLDIGIFTNFSTKNPKIIEALAEHCFFVRGSIDAGSAEVHKIAHVTDDFDRVVNNIRYLLQIRGERPNPVVGVQFVTNQWNWWQLPEAARFYREVGVDYMTIKPAYKNPLNPAHPDNELTPEKVFPLMKEAQSYSTDTFKVYAKFPQFEEVLDYETNDARYYKKCHATPLSPYLDENGNVEMCGNLKGRGFTLGNIYEKSFKDIWYSQQRRDCLNKIDLYKCPAGCKLDPLNKVLWDALYPEERVIHPNFV